MDESLKAAIINARTLSMRAEMEGMLTLNRERESVGYSPAYNECDFYRLEDKHKLTKEHIDEILRW